MVFYMLAMRDIRANVHTQVELWPRIEQAARAFELRTEKDDPKDIVATAPQDFELIVIGEYEDTTATILVYEGDDRRQVAMGKKKANPPAFNPFAGMAPPSYGN